ncbi:MAG: hypothetical protein HKN21_00690, partial [Candidatus Eisenbacteria bacterium]|nr:hypothetical protein [Candidatus Eisenbacteria bacterium]
MPSIVGELHWLSITPEIILIAVASIILMVSAGRGGAAGDKTLWFSVLGVVAAIVAAFMMNPNGTQAFSGAIAVDGLTQIFC